MPKFLRAPLCCDVIIIVITIIYCYHDEFSRNKNTVALFQESSTTIVKCTINTYIILYCAGCRRTINLEFNSEVVMRFAEVWNGNNAIVHIMLNTGAL